MADDIAVGIPSTTVTVGFTAKLRRVVLLGLCNEFLVPVDATATATEKQQQQQHRRALSPTALPWK